MELGRIKNKEQLKLKLVELYNNRRKSVGDNWMDGELFTYNSLIRVMTQIDESGEELTLDEVKKVLLNVLIMNESQTNQLKRVGFATKEDDDKLELIKTLKDWLK